MRKVGGAHACARVLTKLPETCNCGLKMDKIRSIISSWTLEDDGDKEEERDRPPANDQQLQIRSAPISGAAGRQVRVEEVRQVQRRQDESGVAMGRISRSAALVVDDGGEVRMIRRERIEVIAIGGGGDPGSSSSRSTPAISCSTACTFDKYGSEFHTQTWYECYTCWGAGSSFGCCEYCAKTCHVGHRLVRQQPSGFFCDCGKNSHKLSVCTYRSTGKKFMRQPFYRCYTCFSGPGEGCCFKCVKLCHAGHNVAYAGVLSAYCDCGLTCCRSSCKIASP